MALDDLLAALERETSERIAAEGATARAEAERLLAGAEERVARRRAEALARERDHLERAFGGEIAGAAREAERAVLLAREALLARVLDRVRERLAAEPPSPARIGGLVLQALGYAGTVPVEVRVTPELVAALSASLGSRLNGALRPDPAVCGGALLRTTDARLEVDASLAGLLRTRESEARMRILAALEPGA